MVQLVTVKKNEISEKPFLWFTLKMGYVFQCVNQVKACRVLRKSEGLKFDKTRNMTVVSLGVSNGLNNQCL